MCPELVSSSSPQKGGVCPLELDVELRWVEMGRNKGCVGLEVLVLRLPSLGLDRV